MTLPAPSAVHFSACKEISWAPPWRPMNEAQPYLKQRNLIDSIKLYDVMMCHSINRWIVKIKEILGPWMGFVGMKFSESQTGDLDEFRQRRVDYVRVVC